MPATTPHDPDGEAHQAAAPVTEPASLCIFRVEAAWRALEAHRLEAVTEQRAPLPPLPEQVRGVVVHGGRGLALALLLGVPRVVEGAANLDGFGWVFDVTALLQAARVRA